MRAILSLALVTCTGTSVQQIDAGSDVQTLDVQLVDEGLDVHLVDEGLDVHLVDEGLDVHLVDEGLDVQLMDEFLDVQTLDVGIRAPDACSSCSLGLSACYWTSSQVQCCGGPWPVACRGVGCHAFPCPDR